MKREKEQPTTSGELKSEPEKRSLTKPTETENQGLITVPPPQYGRER